MGLCSCDSPLRHMKPESLTSRAGNIVSLNESLNIEVVWTNGPFGLPNKASTLKVQVLDLNMNSIELSDGVQFFIQADMGMGHGLASAGTFYTEDSSLWLNDTLSFYMGGNYLVKLYLFDEDFNELGVAEWHVVF